MGENIDIRVGARVIRGKHEITAKADQVRSELLEKVERVDASQTVYRVEHDGNFDEWMIVQPPADPHKLLDEHRNSNALRQNVDAYGVNIHGHGYTLVPLIDFDHEDAPDMVGDILAHETGTEPTQEEINTKIDELRIRQRRERLRAKLFFDYCCSEASLAELRRNMSMELEIIGHAYWEARRTEGGDLAAFSYVPGATIRALVRKDNVRVERRTWIKSSPIAWDTRIEDVEETLWAQTDQEGQRPRVIFKPFGDRRIISNKSGRAYGSEEDLEREEPNAKPATELIQFKVWSPITQLFGIPRWTGCLKAVQGGRKAEFVNLIFFDNKQVPPLALLVSGGSVTDSAVERIERYIEDELTGDVANFHKILIIEAEPASNPSDPLNSGKVRVELVPLTNAIPDDGMFMKYIAQGREFIGESFRNPKIVRGATEGINRATSIAALIFAESQVYGPERAAFDWWINRFVMPELDITLWDFRSNSPVATDLDAASAIAELTKVGVLVPSEGREFAGHVFNKDLKKIDADWTKQPLQLTLAGVLVGEDGSMSPGIAERQTTGVVSEAANTKLLDAMRKLVKLCNDAGVDPLGPLEEVGRLAKQIIEAPKLTSDPEVVTLRLPGSIDQYIIPHGNES